MSEEPETKSAKDETAFSREVGAKAARKLRARRNSTQGVWFGLGMMGLIGWSVVCSDVARRGARYLARQSPSRKPFLDADAAGHWPGHRLFECLALGGQGRQGDEGGTRG